MKQVVTTFVLISLFLLHRAAVEEKNKFLKAVNDVVYKIITENFKLKEIGYLKNKLTDIKSQILGYFNTSMEGYGQYGLDMKGNISEIEMSGRYNFRSFPLDKYIPITGKGKFKMILKGIKFTGKVDVKLNKNTNALDATLQNYYFTLGSSKIQFENLMNFPSMYNPIVGQLLPQVFKVHGKIKDKKVQLWYGKILTYIVNCVEEKFESNNTSECFEKLSD